MTVEAVEVNGESRLSKAQGSSIRGSQRRGARRERNHSLTAEARQRNPRNRQLPVLERIGLHRARPPIGKGRSSSI
jgi:hypothetical protein